MSATNRGADRIESDNYPTPAWCTRRILEACEQQYDNWPSNCRITKPIVNWLEPCAGEGAIVRVVKEMNHDGARIVANDLRDCVADLVFAGATDQVCSDFLTWPAVTGTAYDIAITNPPFGVAEDVVLRCLDRAAWVVVLVRQGFVGHERAAWMRTNMPDTYELPERPSFAASYKCVRSGMGAFPCGWGAITSLDAPKVTACPECGGRVRRTTSDAADYCWLVWTPERNRSEGRRIILPSTPAAERGVRGRKAAA